MKATGSANGPARIQLKQSVTDMEFPMAMGKVHCWEGHIPMAMAAHIRWRMPAIYGAEKMNGAGHLPPSDFLSRPSKTFLLISLALAINSTASPY